MTMGSFGPLPEISNVHFQETKKTQLLPHCEKTQHFHPPLLPPPSPPTWRRWRRRTAVATGGDGGGDGRRRRDGRRWLRRRTAAMDGGGDGRRRGVWQATGGGRGSSLATVATAASATTTTTTTTATKEGARGGRSRSRRFDLVALDAHSLSLYIYSAPETGAEDDLGQLGFARRARRRAAPFASAPC